MSRGPGLHGYYLQRKVGKLGSLKRFENDAKEVQSGFECGMTIENFNDIKENDVIEAYVIEEVRPE